MKHSSSPEWDIRESKAYGKAVAPQQVPSFFIRLGKRTEGSKLESDSGLEFTV